MLDDAEFDQFLSELRSLLVKYSHGFAEGRRPRDISVISAPAEGKGKIIVVLAIILGTLVCLNAIGFSINKAFFPNELRTVQPYGRLVEVGGRRMRTYSMGKGGKTIVLLPGFGDQTDTPRTKANYVGAIGAALASPRNIPVVKLVSSQTEKRMGAEYQAAHVARLGGLATSRGVGSSHFIYQTSVADILGATRAVLKRVE
jgi:hypothetical protein